MTTEAKRTANPTHNAPEFRHPSEMEWEMGRFNNVTKFLFHPTPERPTVPNAGFLRYEPGAGFPLHKHDFAQVWYIIDGEFQMGERKYGPGTLVYMEDPHFENEMRTETGGTVLFVQYPGPTTGGRPIYEGRMNLKAAPHRSRSTSSIERGWHASWLERCKQKEPARGRQCPGGQSRTLVGQPGALGGDRAFPRCRPAPAGAVGRG